MGLYSTNGGKQQGWEVQNQGQVRRLPGEGPGVNGGRAQSQELDSMDQPQYTNETDEFNTPSDYMMMCPACRGMGVFVTGPGMEDDNPDQACPECDGTGEVPQFKGIDDEDTGFMPRIGEMFGFEEGKVKHMRAAVHNMERTRDELKKSSEKEKKEHPWATKKQAMRIAKDHMNKEGIARAFVIKESPEVLRPGDWYEAVQFHQLDGANVNDVQLRGAGYKVRPNSKPMKGYVVYEVMPDGTLTAREANWDSGD